jgi:carbon storage regulator
MLVLTRRLGESIIIGDDIIITVLNISKDQFYLGVNISESLTINLQETVSIREGITVTAVKIDKGQVRLGIEAPKDITINREEVPKEDQVGNVLSSDCRYS